MPKEKFVEKKNFSIFDNDLAFGVVKHHVVAQSIGALIRSDKLFLSFLHAFSLYHSSLFPVCVNAIVSLHLAHNFLDGVSRF